MTRVCRSCMVQNEGMESIFSTVQQYSITLNQQCNTELCKMFTDFTSLEVIKNDGLPEYLCKMCVKKLQEWFEFKEMCLKSQKIFHEDLVKGFVYEVNLTDLLHSEGTLHKDQREEIKVKKIPVVIHQKNKVRKSNNKIEVANINEDVENTIKEELLDQQIQQNEFKPSDSEKQKDTKNSKIHNKSYICDICGLCFGNLKSLKTHCTIHMGIKNDKIKETNIDENKEKTKKEESKLLDQQKQLNKSENQTDTKESKKQITSYICDICGQCCVGSHSFKTHYITHTGVKNFVCELCGKKCSTHYNLKCHMHLHDEVKLKHECNNCPKTFYTKRDLEMHLRSHTDGPRRNYTKRVRKPRGDSYICPKCNKSCDSEINLQGHVESKCRFRNNENLDKKSGEETMFSCHICKKEFRSKYSFKIHLLRHTANRPFFCTICSRNFPDEATLDAHLRFHARPKPFQCETCDKRFIDRSALRCHIRTHTGEKPFGCEVCVKRFASNMHLKAHMRCHTGEKPYKCSLCNHSFSQQSSYKAHSLLIHNGQV